VILIKFETPANISPKRVKLQTWNLACECIWTISSKWINKISEKGHVLGHVTLIKFGTPSNISPKWVKLQTWNLAHGCTWTISRQWTNKISENGRDVGHVTLIKFGTPSNISPKRVKLQTWNLACGCTWTISPKLPNKISEKGRGLVHVTLIICSYTALRYKTTYLLIPPPYLCMNIHMCVYILCSVVMTTDLVRAACVPITGLRPSPRAVIGWDASAGHTGSV